MKRTILSDQNLREIIGLREKGLSWVTIERQTGVPRRIAKREYDERRQKQSQQLIAEARKEVAAQEYRLHLDLLSHFANHLLDSLVLPHPITDLRRSDEVLSQFLKKDIYQQRQFVQLRLEGEREKRVLRLNELLFKSLRAHTQEKLPWDVLDMWKMARDSCIDHLIKTRKEIHEVFKNIANQYPKTKSKIEKANRGQMIWERVVDGILTYLWLNDVRNDEGKITGVKGQSTVNQGSSWIIFHDKAPDQTRITFNREDAATNDQTVREIVRMSNWAVTNLHRAKPELTGRVRGDVDRMSEASGCLEATLNPLVLRPLILNTLCDICPIRTE